MEENPIRKSEVHESEDKLKRISSSLSRANELRLLGDNIGSYNLLQNVYIEISFKLTEQEKLEGLSLMNNINYLLTKKVEIENASESGLRVIGNPGIDPSSMLFELNCKIREWLAKHHYSDFDRDKKLNREI